MAGKGCGIGDICLIRRGFGSGLPCIVTHGGIGVFHLLRMSTDRHQQRHEQRCYNRFHNVRLPSISRTRMRLQPSGHGHVVVQFRLLHSSVLADHGVQARRNCSLVSCRQVITNWRRTGHHHYYHRYSQAHKAMERPDQGHSVTGLTRFIPCSRLFRRSRPHKWRE